MYSNLDNKEYIDKLYSKESLTDEYTADMRFLQRIQNQVTINGQLPFNVPIDNIPEIIYNSVEWYFRHCEDASEEKWMLLPVSALHVDGNYNSEIKLPFRIISVNEVNAVDSSRAFSMMPYNRRNALRYETMLMTASSYSTLNVGGYAINAVGALYTNRFYDNVADSMMIMNLQGAINSAFSKHYRYKYNRNSRVLRFLTDIPTSNFVLNVTERLLLQDLYDDDRFIKYIVGNVLININFVLSVFDFNMPGNIKVNPDVYINRGQKMIDDVKQELADDSDSPIIMFS